ncbi:MAG: energy-coupling factor transporter transmembrane protein EcfT [Lachnospiraceae bacterium]|nr:energy-coupling factor transporter transmembrane protein EcfT [Lachnospiraceae bacterium]
MFRDITLGQYYPGQSIIHRLDPRTKLLWTLVYIVSLFVADNKYAYGAAVLALAAVIILSSVPFTHMLKGLKTVLVILIISVLFNLFLTDGRVLVSFWIFKITLEGIRRAVFMAVRLVCLILGASLMTYTTTPNQLTDGIERGLGFLKLIRVPVHEIAMMMSIALRFIPILTEELDKIIKAQTARGADLESGNFIKRAKAMTPILIPLFVSAFRRAGDLAQAMEARCYHGGRGRTRMNPLSMAGRDYAAIIIMFAYLGGIIVLSVLL